MMPVLGLKILMFYELDSLSLFNLTSVLLVNHDHWKSEAAECDANVVPLPLEYIYK